jgi:hypothetical protein
MKQIYRERGKNVYRVRRIRSKGQVLAMLANGCAWLRSRAGRPARLCSSRADAAAGEGSSEEDSQQKVWTMRMIRRALGYGFGGLLMAAIVWFILALPGFLSSTSSAITLRPSRETAR